MSKQADAFTIQADAFTMQVDAFTMQADAFTMQADALTMQSMTKLNLLRINKMLYLVVLRLPKGLMNWKILV